MIEGSKKITLAPYIICENKNILYSRTNVSQNDLTYY